MDESEKQGFELLKETIHRLTGFSTRYYRDSYLERRIRTRMRTLGIETFEEYMYYLKKHPDERDRLYQALTINVTEFFRNPEVWDAVKIKVVRPLIDAGIGKPTRPIKIWSAGCSDGREVYSMAMVIEELSSALGRNIHYHILGTDIDRKMLSIAISGEYHDMPLNKVEEQVPPEFLKKYFRKKGKGVYEVIPELKRNVEFKYHDMISGPKFKDEFHIILCRNVVIYFSRVLQEGVFIDLIRALKNRGYLVLGKTETLFGKARELFEVVDSAQRIYILKDGAKEKI